MLTTTCSRNNVASKKEWYTYKCMGKIEIDSLVKTLKEKRTADGILIKVGSLGYVLNIKQSNDKILYLILISSSEIGCPIEVFGEDEIEIA